MCLRFLALGLSMDWIGWKKGGGVEVDDVVVCEGERLRECGGGGGGGEEEEVKKRDGRTRALNSGPSSCCLFTAD